jgi:excisionase family DNA binding protein
MSEPIPEKRQMFLTKEVAALLRVNPRTVRRWMDEGLLEHTHTKRGIRIPREEVVRVYRHGLSCPARYVL